MQTDFNNIDKLDFLPEKYRKKTERRCNNAWLTGLIVVCVGAMAVGAGKHYRTLIQLRTELSFLRQQHEEATEQADRLSQLQDRLGDATTEAELYTYLQYPWPRSALIQTVISVLPDKVVLTELQITQGISTAQATRAERRKQKEKQAEESPAAEDFRTLREATGQTPDTVSIQGWTEDALLLHLFLSRVEEKALVDKAKLISIVQQAKAGREGFQFHVKLTVKPGYGQPNGPTEPPEDASHTAELKGDGYAEVFQSEDEI